MSLVLRKRQKNFLVACVGFFYWPILRRFPKILRRLGETLLELKEFYNYRYRNPYTNIKTIN